MKPKLQILTDGYRLVLPMDPTRTNTKPEQSEVHDFGEPIDYVALDGRRYVGGVTLPDGQEEGTETESILDHWLYVATPVDVDVEDLDEETGPGPRTVVSAKEQLEKILRSAEMAPQDMSTTSTGSKPATKPATITKEN